MVSHEFSAVPRLCAPSMSQKPRRSNVAVWPSAVGLAVSNIVSLEFLGIAYSFSYSAICHQDLQAAKGATIAGPSRIIGVDLNSNRFEEGKILC